MQYYVNGKVFETEKEAMSYENELKAKAEKELNLKKEKENRKAEIAKLKDEYEKKRAEYEKKLTEYMKDYGGDVYFTPHSYSTFGTLSDVFNELFGKGF